MNITTMVKKVNHAKTKKQAGESTRSVYNRTTYQK
jgi:hypothetical protein